MFSSNLEDFAHNKYGTIYADPPWQYGNQGTRSCTNRHYNTLSFDELTQLPVNRLSQDDAHLHLWTTNAFIGDALALIDAWGFIYKSCFVWAKTQMGIGNYWRVSHEFLLLGVRGNVKRFNTHTHKSWKELPRQKHSQKPEEIRQIIEEVSPGPFLELFGRKETENWDTFGNEIKF